MANNGNFRNFDGGKETLETAIDSSAGVGDASKIVKTDATGRLDNSLLPVGIGADTLSIPSSENLSAGSFVNVYDNGGTVNVRLADNSNGREANGFVLASVTSPANATVYFEGTNTQLSGLTLGVRYFLGTAGGVTTTAPTASGEIIQYLGKSSSATEINVEMSDCIEIS